MLVCLWVSEPEILSLELSELRQVRAERLWYPIDVLRAEEGQGTRKKLLVKWGRTDLACYEVLTA